jgi:hypothetical protein
VTVHHPPARGPAAPPSCATPRLKGAPRSDVNANGDDCSHSRLTIERAALHMRSSTLGRSHRVLPLAPPRPAAANSDRGVIFKRKNSPDREAGANRRHHPSPRPEDLSVDEHRQPSPPSWLASGNILAFAAKQPFEGLALCISVETCRTGEARKATLPLMVEHRGWSGPDGHQIDWRNRGTADYTGEA